MKKITNRIVHIVSYYPPHLGGMENCAQELTKKLAEKGYTIDVYTSNIGAENKTEERQKNHTVFYLKSIEFAHTPIIFSLFFKLLHMPKPKLMHLHVSQAFSAEIVFLISKLRKIPYIAHIHMDVDQSGPFGFLLKPYKRFFLKPILHHASKIICLSELQKDIISAKYGLKKEKITVLPNGVSKAFFIKRTLKRNNVLTLLFVGRFARQKNVPRLINAINLMHEKVMVRIIGDGEDRNKIESLIKNYKLKNVLLLGKKTGEALVNEYKNADIFVLTSNKEGVPLVLLEAMAAGLPIVASNISGVNEILGDAGIVINNLVPNEFAKTIDNLILNKKLREELSMRAQKKAGNYNWDTIVTKLEKIYQI